MCHVQFMKISLRFWTFYFLGILFSLICCAWHPKGSLLLTLLLLQRCKMNVHCQFVACSKTAVAKVLQRPGGTAVLCAACRYNYIANLWHRAQWLTLTIQAVACVRGLAYTVITLGKFVRSSKPQPIRTKIGRHAQTTFRKFWVWSAQRKRNGGSESSATSFF